MDDSDCRSVSRLANYTRIRVIGKGGFGTAVLYRNDEDSFIVVKQINMIDLTGSERQLALNEVKVLSMLKHPNIVSYYDSFEEDGVLYIQMEYGDGGTLSDFLAKMDIPMEEHSVLLFFKQIVAATHHMHERGILHRDMKTANIFLFGDNLLKVGDFGISKIMNLQSSKAQTVVGTPCYISPEMCEGKPYDKQSDVWALGCVLYEMVCLHRTFEGTNLPALVYKIMKGQFAPINGNYSLGLRELIRSLLQQDPNNRPSTHEIHNSIVPELLVEFSSVSRKKSLCDKAQLRSVVYSIQICDQVSDINVVPLPGKIKISQLSCSSNHVIALTSDCLVFTWGDNSKSQLGIGSCSVRKNDPECVEALSGKQINCVAAGEGFSVFSSSNGIVLTCGDGSRGCLGHGSRCSESQPKIVESLLSADVCAISCGSYHVMALGADGSALSWGSGKQGRLGLGDCKDRWSPTVVKLEGMKAVQISCGYDSTMFVTSNHHIFACGNNQFNKLGLDLKIGPPCFKKTQTIDFVSIPTEVKGIVDVDSLSMGLNHSVILFKNGKVKTLGCNDKGQLGVGNKDWCHNIQQVATLSNKSVCMLQCGLDMTVIGTSDNVIFAWGEVEQESRNDSLLSKQDSFWLIPQEILALYSSTTQVENGISLNLSSVHCQGKRVLVVVNTTSPLTHRRECNNYNDKTMVDTFGHDNEPETPSWLEDEFQEFQC